MKKCPYCAEEIQDEAIVCRYCGRDLAKPVPPAQPVVQQNKKAKNSVGQTILYVVGAFIAVCLMCIAVTGIRRLLGPKATQQLEPTQTPIIESSIVIRTFTPGPTNTAEPTKTPRPTITPTPIPQPIFLISVGDSVFNIEKWKGPAILKMKYTGGGNFAVRNYPAQSDQYYDLLVNTIGKYEGTVPLDFRDGEQTARFEVKADMTGSWEFHIEPISSARVEKIPGVITGNGDDVVLIGGATPDLVKVDASQASRNFAIRAIANSKYQLIVNEIAPYAGTNMLSPSTVALIINATGPWKLELTTKEQIQESLSPPPEELQYTIVAKQGVANMVVIDPQYKTDRQTLLNISNEICKGKLICIVMFWDDEKKAANSIPMTDQQAFDEVAQYNINKNTNNEQLLLCNQNHCN